MSDDLIKRSDAIEAIEDTTWYHQNRNKDMVSGANSDDHQAWYKDDDVYKALEEVPSADRPQEWIPCSDRLPEEKEVVAIIIKQWDTGEIKKGITYRVDHNMWVGFGRHNKACVWWLPLPPWEGADDDC